MSKSMKIATRALSAAMAVALLAGACVYALPSLLAPKAGEDTQVVLDGETFRFSELKAPAAESEAKGPPKVGSMAKLLGLLKENGALYLPAEDEAENGGGTFMMDRAVAESAMPAPAAAPAATPAPAPMEPAGDTGYSQTNTQVSGVDEGDIVKTDGKYLYAARLDDNTVSIIQADGKDMKRLSSVVLPEDKDNEHSRLQEMYVTGDHLVVVSTRNIQPDYPEGTARTLIWRPSKQLTRYTVYDIKDRAKPRQTRVVELEGSPVSTRMVGNTLYFVQNRHLYGLAFTTALRAEDVLPAFSDSAKGDAELEALPPEDMNYFPGSEETNYMLIGAFDVTKAEAFEPQCYLGAGNTVYMNERSLYVARYDWRDEATGLYRFTVDGAEVIYAAKGSVKGTPINQYAMDEYDGHFRIAATSQEKTSVSRVYVLDGEMKQTGVTPALAPGEQIYSVRFMGDMGYLVTYRQVDPLFAVDLSDPKKPTVVGQLKIPGFSQYLHPVGEGLLVGFGRHTQVTYVREDDGTEVEVGTRDAGLKVSLFDISDPKNPKEVNSLRLGAGSYSEAFDNPRAMMVDRQKSLFGFPIQVQDWNELTGNPRVTNWEGFMLVGVKEEKLVKTAELKYQPDATGEYYRGWQRRLCYIGNTLYGVDDVGVTAFDYTTFKQLAVLKLD
jgi:uncharacterized secreted protein with C-terminal beta-propeller domain